MSRLIAGNPFRWTALLTGAALWNVLVFSDRHLLGYPLAQGPLTVVALGALAAISFTLPFDRRPGRWLLKHARPAPAVPLLFHALGSLAALLAAGLALTLLRG